MQSLKEEEEDAKKLARYEEKRKEWTKHSQSCTEVQDQEKKPWRNEELKKLEEDLPRLKESDLAEAAKIYKTNTGVGCDGFHPEVPQDSAKRTGKEAVEFLEKVEQCVNWPQQTCKTMLFSGTEENHERATDCAYANDGSLVGSLKGARGGQMAIQVSY